MVSVLHLSVIVPVYNVAPYLRACLDSLAASPSHCWEAILIDDGSPDDCPAICEEFASRDSRFTVIHQKNRGVSAARNAGLEAAKGEWIWFVDADDMVDARPIGRALEWLGKHPLVDLAIFSLISFHDGAVPTMVQTRIAFPQNVGTKDTVLHENVCFHHQRLWYRRDIIARHHIRFPAGIRVAEDLEFQYKYLIACSQPAAISYPIYYYRERSGSATQNGHYRETAVTDINSILNNLYSWCAVHCYAPESWLDYRIMLLFQNLLYSATQIKHLDLDAFQQQIRDLSSKFQALGYSFVRKPKYKLAVKNVRVYILFNRIYTRLFVR